MAIGDAPKPEKQNTSTDVLKYLEDMLKLFKDNHELSTKEELDYLIGAPTLRQTIEAAKKGNFRLADDYLRCQIEFRQKMGKDAQQLDKLISLRRCLLN